MLSRRSRLLLLPAGLLALLLAAVSFAIFWSQRGPGFRREVDRLASIMELHPGMTGAEIGAGSGRMAVRIAQHLGASGHLYATEIEADKLQAIRSAASAAGLTNITVIQAGEHSAGLPDNCCDIIFMRRVYHHFTDAAATNQTLHAALRPGGRLVIIDFVSPRWMFLFHHGIPSDLLAGQVTAAGFTLERRIDGWSPIDYCLIFRKHPLSARVVRPLLVRIDPAELIGAPEPRVQFPALRTDSSIAGAGKLEDDTTESQGTPRECLLRASIMEFRMSPPRSVKRGAAAPTNSRLSLRTGPPSIGSCKLPSAITQILDKMLIDLAHKAAKPESKMQTAKTSKPS